MMPNPDSKIINIKKKMKNKVQLAGKSDMTTNANKYMT